MEKRTHRGLDIQAILSKITRAPLAEAIALLNDVEYHEDLVKIAENLEASWEATGNVVVAYCAATAFFDIDVKIKAKDLFLVCGERGLASGYYRAALLIGDLEMKAKGSPDSNNEQQLDVMRRAAELGHVFGKLSYYRRKKKNLREMTFYFFYRFFFAPMQILVLGLFSSDSDKIRV